MPESLPADVAALRDRTEALARDTLVSLRDDDSLDASTLRARVRDASKDAGLFTTTQPEDFGGTRTSLLAMTAVRDTLGAFNVGHLPGLFGPGPGVLAGVDEPLKSDYLTPLLAGEKRSAFGFTEPDKAPRATWGAIKGDRLVINGQKSYVTGGDDADFINVLVEIDDHGPAMVVVDRHAPGVEVTARFGTLDGSHHAYFEFHDVDVPLAHVIGKPGEGIPRALRQIGNTRLVFAAESVGICRYVIDFVTDHLNAPHRSGTPLGAREGVRMRYADLRIKAYAARSMLYRTARLGDAGENIFNETVATKVYATEVVGEVVDMGIQLVGGIALRTDHPFEELYRRVRTMRLAEGASDILRINLAKGRLERELGRI